ncbi:MAG: outer membrane beta-barrel protein [Cecembia sp.]
MKIFKTLSFFLLISISAMAQTEKGKMLLGAGTHIGFSNGIGMMDMYFTNTTREFADGTSEERSSYNIFFAPKVGYFLIDNLAAGIDLAFGWGMTEIPIGDFTVKSNNALFGAGPFVRYYVPKGKILPFAEVNTLFGNQRTRTDIAGDDESNTGITSFGGGFGLALLLGERSSFDLLLNYSSNRANFESDGFYTRQNTIGIKFGYTIFLGK